jgi:hypothetical protein
MAWEAAQLRETSAARLGSPMIAVSVIGAGQARPSGIASFRLGEASGFALTEM